MFVLKTFWLAVRNSASMVPYQKEDIGYYRDIVWFKNMNQSLTIVKLSVATVCERPELHNTAA